MAGAGNRRGAGAERDRRRRGPLEAEAASDRERPAAAGPPRVHILQMRRRWRRKGQPRHRSGATVERDRLGQNVKSRQRPEVCPCSVGELGGFHAMLTTRGPKLLHGGEPRSVANVDATPNATATAHPRASRGRAIASKFRRLRALQNQIQPMALKAQHTISKLRKKLIRGRDLLPELWGHDCGGDWSGH